MAKTINKSLMKKAKTQSKRDRKAAATKTRKVAKAKKVAAKAAARSGTAGAAKPGKWVYAFGDGKADGKSDMRNLLGGKGANLAEMANLGLPVPPGFTISTDVCVYFYANGKKYPKELQAQVSAALAHVGKLTGKVFGDANNPLLVSVRSGARASMPGMMDTVLNLGLNDVTVEALAKKSGDRRFAYDSYRRFITMYSDVVLGVESHHFEEILDEHKERNGYVLDTDMTDADWVEMVKHYKARVKEELGEDFPQDPGAQLWGAIGAVFGSWMNTRANTYRRLHSIPESWGTAVNVQAMVFGNMGETSATGVAFTRNPSTGEKRLYGESSSMRRARTSSPASARRRKSPRLRARKHIPTSRRWKRQCRWRSRNSRASTTCLRSTTATCRISNSRSSRASCGCCKPAAASARRRPRCASRSNSQTKD